MDVVRINDLHDIIMGDPEILNKGAYASVFRCARKQDGEIYAFKAIFKGESHYKNTAIKREKVALQSLDHPNIIKLMGLFENATDVFFMLEFAAHRDLHYWIKRVNSGNGLQRDVVEYWAAEQIKALEYLRTKGIVHRDLKSDNVMINHDFHTKLTDFGTAKHIQDTNGLMLHDKNSYVGTLMFLAPEVMRPGPVTFGTDLWGLAVLLSEMFYKLMWVCEKKPNEPYRRWVNRIDEQDYTFPYQGRCTELEDLIHLLCRSDPKQRLGIEDMSELKSHSFFSNTQWHRLHRDPPPRMELPTPHMLDHIFLKIDPIQRRKPLEQGVETYEQGIFDAPGQAPTKLTTEPPPPILEALSRTIIPKAPPHVPNRSRASLIAEGAQAVGRHAPGRSPLPGQTTQRYLKAKRLHRNETPAGAQSSPGGAFPRLSQGASSFYDRITAPLRKRTCPVHTIPMSMNLLAQFEPEDYDDSDSFPLLNSEQGRKTPPGSPARARSTSSPSTPRHGAYTTPQESPSTPPARGRSGTGSTNNRQSAYFSPASHFSESSESIFESPQASCPAQQNRPRSTIVSANGGEVPLPPLFQFDWDAWRNAESPPPEVAVDEMEEDLEDQSKCCCKIC